MAATPTDGRTPSYVDPSKASIARVYDFALGGKDNYEIDRETIRQVEAVAPEAKLLAVENRGFLIRALRFLSTQTDVTQFLDCGSGLPTAENTHQVVKRLQPEARVVYVDNDPTVVAHGRALLEDDENTMFSPADIFAPEKVLGDPGVQQFLDLSQPVVLIQNGTLHHYDDPARSPQSIMESYVDALPSGSYVVIAHFFDPEDGGADSALARRLEDVFVHSPMGSGMFRTRAEIEGMFPGLEMVEPGIELCAQWWPDGPLLNPLAPAQRCIVGGVGRKP
ncbi:SAM-dependent methyltransferase [Pseudonocardia sp. KRD291]|uniref:SAM-dependent methyltransferase n=1 Tax=Pseudonocardia sp. KRD291 TaxID=2792007 RepID=UPI001C4A2C8D|nr:SAM-dependent methyltransferase [Pseudonocardia sp. KRD291]MBW0105408.1 SAM-dependent methyltransferase [Pseudonocardia sp. KRD291]